MSRVVERWEGAAEPFDRCVERRGWAYQSHAFGELLRKGLGQRIVRLVVRDGGELRGVLSLAVLKSPLFGRFAVSLPVSDHSGLCAEDPEALDALLGAVRDLLGQEGLSHAELRHLGASAPAVDLPASEHKLTLQLELPGDPEELWGSLKAKVRNLVRKGEKAGLRHVEGGRELLAGFYPVYARNLRDLGTPCYPRSLFEAWLDSFPEATRIHLALLPEGDEVVAGGFTFAHRDRQQIPFAASRREHRALSPNMFLYWRMLETSIRDGLRCFDFGRSTREGGTWRFKRQWGAVERPLLWHYVLAPGAELPSLRVDSPRYRLAVSAWRRLPVGVATALGGRLVRHLP